MRYSKRSEVKQRLMSLYCRRPWTFPIVRILYTVRRLAHD